MERIRKLKTEAEKQSQELLQQKQQLLASIRQSQERVQQIDIQVVALSGKVQGFNELLQPEKKEVKNTIPRKRPKK